MNQKNNNFEKNGVWEEYYENGQLSWKANYQNDKLHGPYESYFSNGKISFKAIYNNGELNGPYETYYDDGKPYSKGIFKLKRPIGLLLYYRGGKMFKKFYL